MMLGLQIVLAAVLAVAGIAKLADPSGSRRALQEFGAPVKAAGFFGILLPVGELLIAICLIPMVTARAAAVVATALFLLFAAAIGFNLYRGRRPDCHCFGQLHSSPAGWNTFGRNIVLALASAVVVWRGGQGFPDRASSLSAATWITIGLAVLTVGALAVIGWLMLNLLQQNGRLLLRLEALEAAQLNTAAIPNANGLANARPSRPAPAFDLPAIDNTRLTLDAILKQGKPALLIFSDPQCGPCNQLLPDIGRWHRELTRLQVAVISRGDLSLNVAKGAEHGIPRVAIQRDREVALAFGVSGTPGAVVVETDGMIRHPVAAGADAIRSLVSRISAPDNAQGSHPGPLHAGNGAATEPARPRPPGLAPGEAAPSFSLPDLDGTPVSSEEFRDKSTVLLFWNPGCGFCGRMLDDLKRWEMESSPDARRLVLVSTGGPDANRAMNLRSPVLLDNGTGVSRLFGSTGTPTAVLVDGEGRIASRLATGATDVLELLKSPIEDPARPAGNRDARH